MDAGWFDNLFEGDFEEVYDDILDRVVDAMDEHVYVSGSGDGDGDNNNDDDNEELIWQKKLQKNKLLTCTAGAVSLYYCYYMHKEPCMTSYQTGERWLNEILNGHWKRCVNMFRMDAETLKTLCMDLESNYGLTSSRRMSAIEKVAMFLYTLALGASNRQVQERFQHSGETVSRYFYEVLKAVCLLSMDIVKPRDLEFRDILPQIEMDTRYMPHFKNCIGAIDGTHVSACVPPLNQIPFIGRHGIPTQNIMAACSFDMQFTYVWAGWEGSAHDSYIFTEAINNSQLNFPKPPPGKYYLVDAGYPNEYGYLGPYKGERYHLPDFRRGGRARSRKEVFNRAHSSLRSVIERTFGVWKKRWKILEIMPSYPYKKQIKIVVASMALHNYIRRNSQNDYAFTQFDRHHDFVPRDIFPNVASPSETPSHSTPSQMDDVRNTIAASLIGN